MKELHTLEKIFLLLFASINHVLRISAENEADIF